MPQVALTSSKSTGTRAAMTLPAEPPEAFWRYDVEPVVVLACCLVSITNCATVIVCLYTIANSVISHNGLGTGFIQSS